MMSGDGDKIVIVVKKKSRRNQHHGGSWKVAYADFVTAMMAFFLVMWIMGMESDVKDLVQGYFNNPVGFDRSFGGGASPLSTGSSPVDSPLTQMPMFVRQVEERRFRASRDEIMAGLDGLMSEGADPAVVVDVLTGGLRVELREREGGGTSFGFGSDTVRPGAVEALRVIAEVLARLPNRLVIEGHTDATAYGTQAYTNWELSVDRANAARRVLVASGVAADRIEEVRGYADQRLLRPDDPFHATNRRVTILVPFTDLGGSGGLESALGDEPAAQPGTR